MTSDDRWPLSAAATSVLLSPRTDGQALLRLAVKELVVVGALALTRVDRPRRWRSPEQVVLVRHAGAAPRRAPLPLVAAALRAACPDGGQLREVVATAVKADRGLSTACREAVLDELVSLGLVRREKRLLRTVAVRTPSGDVWAQGPAARHAQWQVALAAGGPGAAAAAAAATAAPALVLLMDRSLLAEVDAHLRRHSGDVMIAVDGDSGDAVRWDDLEAVDGVTGLDAAVDSAVDSGSSDGGGDGGGGGGD